MDRLACLYDQLGPRVFRYLLGILGNRSEAEDVLQTVFLELLRRPAVLQQLQSPLAYVIAAARNAALRCIKQSRRRRQMETAAHFLEARDPVLHHADEVERLERALSALPLEQREVIVLKTFEDLTFEEIGRSLKISPNTAASRYRYALEKLRHLLL